MFFLSIDQYNYTKPPKSSEELTCRKSTLPRDTQFDCGGFLFSINATKSESRPVPRCNVSGRFLHLGPVYAWLAIDRSQVF